MRARAKRKSASSKNKARKKKRGEARKSRGDPRLTRLPGGLSRERVHTHNRSGKTRRGASAHVREGLKTQSASLCAGKALAAALGASFSSRPFARSRVLLQYMRARQCKHVLRGGGGKAHVEIESTQGGNACRGVGVGKLVRSTRG